MRVSSEIQGTDSFVRNSESFEIAGVRNSGCLLYLKYYSFEIFEIFSPMSTERKLASLDIKRLFSQIISNSYQLNNILIGLGFLQI